jgi:hypothetical protein
MRGQQPADPHQQPVHIHREDFAAVTLLAGDGQFIGLQRLALDNCG